VSGAIRRQLRQHAFREFCAFNIDAERTAALAWARLAELAEALPRDAHEARAYRRMEADEHRHAQLFESFSKVLTADDKLVPGETAESLAATIGAIDEVFLPRALRTALVRDNPLGSGGRVVVRRGDPGADKRAVFRKLLEDAGLRALVAERAGALGKDVRAMSVVVKPSFMLGCNRRDLSPITDPTLLVELANWLHELGIEDVALIEAPNLYDHFYAHRTVKEVADYLGIEGPFRIVDAADDQVPHSFVRGMGQHSIGRTWQDADLRLSFSKMRSHPIEMAYLTVANVESLGDRGDAFVFSERQVHRDAALMTVINAFPPHFALIDAYERAPDGLAGIMGCPHPKTPRRLYAGADAIAVDLTAARHMGIADPSQFPLLRAACYWFGDPTDSILVEGDDTPIADWRGPYATEVSTLLSFLASPVYQFGSGRGALFVAEIDEEAFPPLSPESRALKAARAAIRALLRLRLP
jgi:uncharacterized protein (DUF362 family)